MANLLPLPKALEQAREAALDYAAAIDRVKAQPEDRALKLAAAKAYQKLSSAQWEVEQLLK
jgi:hypothetical protein